MPDLALAKTVEWNGQRYPVRQVIKANAYVRAKLDLPDGTTKWVYLSGEKTPRAKVVEYFPK